MSGWSHRASERRGIPRTARRACRAVDISPADVIVGTQDREGSIVEWRRGTSMPAPDLERQTQERFAGKRRWGPRRECNQPPTRMRTRARDTRIADRIRCIRGSLDGAVRAGDATPESISAEPQA